MRRCRLNPDKPREPDMRKRRLTGTATRACVFCGPSMSGHERPRDVDLYPPATRGSLLEAISAGYTVLGFIDGALESPDVVPLAELRQALATPGLRLIGGASMGAVRAVQLEAAGMQGAGRIFRLFRRGYLSDSDEVYVLHAPGALRYRPLTLPLVNIRYTLRRMRRRGYITAIDEDALVAYMRDVPWFDRDRQSLSAAVYTTCGSSRRTQVVHWFDRMYWDAKHDDAMSVISAVHKHVSAVQRSDVAGAVCAGSARTRSCTDTGAAI